MILGHEARLRNLAAPLRMGFSCVCVLGFSVLAIGSLSGCKGFWDAPAGSSDFALSNGGNITVTAGATSGNTSVISVTPSNSFSGTVTLSCAVTTSISNPTSAPTCSLSPTSVSISGTAAVTSTLTATTTSTTTSGSYSITVTGASSGAMSETTSVCVEVGSGTCTSSAGTSGVFYVLNQTTNQIAAFTATSSGLTTVGTTALPAAGASAIAVAPSGSFLYVSTGSGIFFYAIASNGTLAIQNNSQPISLDLASSMQVDSTNSWLVDVVNGIAEVNAIHLDPNAGGLATSGETEQVLALPSTTPVQVAISPTSTSCAACYVFVAMAAGGTEIIHFNPASANPFTSSTGAINPVSSQGGANTVAVDPQNRLLYVGETVAVSGTQTGGLRVFTIAASGVTPLGSPYTSGGTGPSSILPTADGNYVYVANQSVSGNSKGNIEGFSVSTSSLTTIGSTAAGPTGHLGLAEDSTGTYVLAVDFAGNPDLQAYTMSSGVLTSAVTDPTGTDPVGAVGVAAAP